MSNKTKEFSRQQSRSELFHPLVSLRTDSHPVAAGVLSHTDDKYKYNDLYDYNQLQRSFQMIGGECFIEPRHLLLRLSLNQVTMFHNVSQCVTMHTAQPTVAIII